MLDVQDARDTDRAGSNSVIGTGVVIRGGVASRGALQLDGEVHGEVRVDQLTLSETATIEGSIEAVTVEIRGHVKGTIKARDVRLFPTARVEADITYEDLSLDRGARLQGRCAPANGGAGKVGRKGK